MLNIYNPSSSTWLCLGIGRPLSWFRLALTLRSGQYPEYLPSCFNAPRVSKSGSPSCSKPGHLITFCPISANHMPTISAPTVGNTPKTSQDPSRMGPPDTPLVHCRWPPWRCSRPGFCRACSGAQGPKARVDRACDLDDVVAIWGSVHRR